MVTSASIVRPVANQPSASLVANLRTELIRCARARRCACIRSVYVGEVAEGQQQAKPNSPPKRTA